MGNCFMLLTVFALSLTAWPSGTPASAAAVRSQREHLPYALDYYTIYVCGTSLPAVYGG